MRSVYIQKMSICALLIAVGIVIPMFMPVKLVLEPASFTLASHVAIMLAMMISPYMAIAVAVGTTAGFFIGGFSLVVVLRAATHLIFSFTGAIYLSKHSGILASPLKSQLFSLCIALIHAAAEVLVVMPFFWGGNMSGSYYEKGFLFSVLILVGAGTIIHSMIDFAISLLIMKALRKQPSLTPIFVSLP